MHPLSRRVKLARPLAAPAVAVLVGIAVWEVHGVFVPCAAGGSEASAPIAREAPTGITARGRLEPKDRVIKVAGPSQAAIFANVVRELYVKEDDTVTAGQVIGIFDSHASKEAAVARLRAELSYAQLQNRRFEELYRKKVVSAEERDEWLTKLDIAKARLQEAEADLELARIRAPISGQVLKIHAYPGERVGSDGILELGDTDEMYAVAEVYEDDIGRVRTGQRATVTSPALREQMQGTVEHIGATVGKMDVLDEDPAAKIDARVVEVRIRLDDSQRVAGLTNLKVDVRISP
jgi:HlyD family secretion protein